MTAITPVIVKSGLSGTRRMHGAQVLDTVVFCNGYDANQILSVRAMAVYALGMSAPAAAPTAATNGAGNVLGNVRYRVKWRDKLNKTMSLSSASVAITAVNNTIRVTAPANPPARATHWVIERTLDSGGTYYPVNRVIVETASEGPDGTPIATTTYDDNYPDIDAVTPGNGLFGRVLLNNNQGVPEPYRYCFANENRIFMCDKCPISLTVTMTNGSAAVVVSGATAFAAMIGWDFTICDDVDGKSYRVSAVPAGNITLDAVYTGTSGAKTGIVCGERARIAWSEWRDPESYGKQNIGFLDNEDVLGTAGEPTIGGIGLGRQGVLWAKETHLYYHTYSDNPRLNPSGDGSIRQTTVRRGIVGPKALFAYNGFVWGMDAIGIWRMEPGGEPVEIGQNLGYEFKRNMLYQCNGYNWHISVDPLYRWLYFNICENNDTYPTKTYIWDLDKGDWKGSKKWWLGMTCADLIKDKNDAHRHGMYFEAASATAGSRMFCDNIGKSLGVKPGQLLTGTATAGGASTLTCSGAGWTTGDPDLSGLPVTKIAAADGAEETRTIESNTATVLTVTPAWTTAPVNGDAFRIGPIEAQYLTGWLDCGAPDRKKRFKQAWIKLKYKTACTYLYVKVYKDNSTTPITDWQATNEDGVYIAAGGSAFRLDATNGQHRYPIPLSNIEANHIKFEVYSRDPGEPWELNGDIVIEYEYDQTEAKRRG